MSTLFIIQIRGGVFCIFNCTITTSTVWLDSYLHLKRHVSASGHGSVVACVSGARSSQLLDCDDTVPCRKYVLRKGLEHIRSWSHPALYFLAPPSWNLWQWGYVMSRNVHSVLKHVRTTARSAVNKDGSFCRPNTSQVHSVLLVPIAFWSKGMMW